jgi:hypothetical protein
MRIVRRRSRRHGMPPGDTSYRRGAMKVIKVITFIG